MERTDDISTSVMPRPLIWVTIIVLIMRIGIVPFELSRSAASTSSIPWQTIDRFNATKCSGNKLVLYEFGADWCEPCKRLEKNVLNNKQIARMITTRFTPVRVSDRLKEDRKNTQQISDLEKKYHVFAFPTMVVAGADGEAIASLVGSASALSTVHFLSRALKPQQK